MCMKCLNCGGTVFEEMPLYECRILCTSGDILQIVESYVCMNCGRVELRMPQALIDRKKEGMRAEAEHLRAEEARKQEEMRLRARVEELEGILQDDGRTLKELREVQAELTALQDRLGIRDRRICLKL